MVRLIREAGSKPAEIANQFRGSGNFCLISPDRLRVQGRAAAEGQDLMERCCSGLEKLTIQFIEASLQRERAQSRGSSPPSGNAKPKSWNRHANSPKRNSSVRRNKQQGHRQKRSV